MATLGCAAYTWLEPFTLDQTAALFRDRVRPNCDIWVATTGGEVVAFLAINGSFVERTYVDPAYWRQGWGTRLVALAKDLSPDGLKLFTHAENRAARSLYERHGFKSARFFTSDPPESAPYVTYEWRPDRKR